MLRAARWVSIFAHPFVMIPLWIAAITLRVRGPQDIARNVGWVALFVVVPNLLFMVWQVRRGAWRNVDASQRAERPALYFVGLSTLALLLAWLAWGRPNSFLLRGATGTLAMLAVCALTSRWVKVSLHLAAASLTATSLILAGSVVGWMVVALIPPLAWSRRLLGRHNWAEIAVGFAYGVVTAVLIERW
jgi:hypothetical protein